MKNQIYHRQIVKREGEPERKYTVLVTLTQEVNGFALFREGGYIDSDEDDWELTVVKWFQGDANHTRNTAIEEAVAYALRMEAV